MLVSDAIAVGGHTERREAFHETSGQTTEPTIAERRVRLGLLVNQVIADAGIVLDPERLRERVEEMCSSYENAEEMVNAYLSNPQLMAQIEPMVLEDQAVDWLIGNGVEKSNTVPFKEYMKPGS